MLGRERIGKVGIVRLCDEAYLFGIGRGFGASE
jgi:hypothetical protein